MPEIKSRENEVLATIQEIEVPFMLDLKAEFEKDLKWSICAPASIALSRILSSKTGIPIVRNGQGEHLELYMGLYLKASSRDSTIIDILEASDEQTYIRYYTGNGTAYYIDPILGVLFHQKQPNNRPILVEKYESANLEESLRSRYGLTPFDPKLARLIPRSSFARMTAEHCLISWNDLMGAVHDFRATMPAFIADSGQLIKTQWYRVSRIINRFAPNWQEDLASQNVAYQEVLTVAFQRSPSEEEGKLLSSFIKDPFILKSIESKKI